MTQKERVYHQAYRQRPEVKERQKEYQQFYQTLPSVKERKRVYQKGYVRTYHLRKQYGLTPEDFESMLSGQNHSCAVCKTTRWGKPGPMVDHDHKTRAVRGILCFSCNAAAGLLKDSPTRAKKMANYLKARNSKIPVKE